MVGQPVLERVDHRGHFIFRREFVGDEANPLGVRGRIVNLSGLVDLAQVLSLAEAELAGTAQDEPVLAVVAPRGV